MPGPVRYDKKGRVKKAKPRVITGSGSRPLTKAEQRSPRVTTYSPRKATPKPSKAPKARRSPLATPEVKSAVERLRKRYTPSSGGAEAALGRDRSRTTIQENELDDLAAKSVTNPGLSRVENIARQNSARQNTALSSDGKTVKRFRGKQIVGTPSTKSVARAAKEGSLRGKKKLTTPEVRQTTRQVRKARRQVRRAKAQMRTGIEGPLTPGQKKFAEELAKRTAINPRVAGAWALSEMSNNYATAREADGNHNWLNIGYFDSGPDPTITNDPAWRNPVTAAKATAQFLRGQKFGAGANIPSILPRSRGASDEEQIRAISESGWASSSYEKGASLRGTRDLIGFTPPKPGAKKRLERAKGKLQRLEDKAAELGLPTNRERQSGPVSWGPKKAKQLDGAWAGTQAILEKAGRGFDISSRKRDANDPLSLSNPGSDHNTANADAYAHDIPAVGDENGIPIAEAYHKRLGLNEPLAIGTYNSYTSRKYPGYRFQVLWNVDGHYDHVHVGAKWTGEDLPAGTYLGGSGSSYTTGGSGVNIAAGGGGTAPASSGPTGRKRRQATILDRLRRPEIAAQLRQMGFEVTPQGVFRVDGENLSQTEFKKMKERFGIK